MKDILLKVRERVWMEGDPDKDHSAGLVVFGALFVLLGVVAFVIAMALMVATSSAGLGGAKVSQYRIVMGVLFGLSVWCILIGLGSAKAKRWARSMILAGSWVSVFFGALFLAVVLYLLPDVFDLAIDAGWLSTGFAMRLLYGTFFLAAALLLVVPVAAIVFYGLRGVQNTCERKNPAPCWTDRLPLPLLAMGLVSLCGFLYLLFGASSNYVVFLFGHVVTGWKGFSVLLGVSAAYGYVGWGGFARKIHAWWLAYVVTLLVAASMMHTFSDLDMGSLYAAMGYDAEQVAQLEQIEFLNPATLTFATCLWSVLACILLAWVRDAFMPEERQARVKSYRQRKAEEAASDHPIEPARMRMRMDP